MHGRSSSASKAAVYGEHSGQGFGVIGDSGAAGNAGVLGRNGAGDGVRGEGRAGVVGVSATPGYEGVYGQSTNGGFGVVGDGEGVGTAGVLGRNSLDKGIHGVGKTGVHGVGATGVYGVGDIGVHGVSAATNSPAVVGEAIGAAIGVKGTSVSGYGAVLSGGRAPLRLYPRTNPGKPTTGSHQIGELSLDKVGALFICTVAGTPGTWRKVSTTLA
jgi:hypothetical protein